MKETQRSLLAILIVILLFAISSSIIQQNIEGIENFIYKGYIIGALVYIFIVAVAVVIAPVSVIPLIPLMSMMYGWQISGLLSILGWTLGAGIAFKLSREYGIPLVKKFISLKKIENIEKKIPKRNIFWSIVFLRMALPVDILSYALGLFSKVKFKTYLIATIIGITPFAFILAYIGILPIYYQIISLAIGSIIIILGVLIKKNKK
ncbi:MAG: VTT domain-containing protein [Nanoarchaeota archaeon]|nr:VTT domain-containing protein [Nanoarchaeota archaeon]